MGIIVNFLFIPFFMLALLSFYWSIDCIVHNKVKKKLAIIVSVFAFGLYLFFDMLSGY